MCWLGVRACAPACEPARVPAAAARLRMCVCAHEGREGGSHCHGNADKYKYASTHRSHRNSLSEQQLRGKERQNTTEGQRGPPVTVTAHGPLPGLDAHMVFSPLLLDAGPSWGGRCRRTPTPGEAAGHGSGSCPVAGSASSGGGHRHASAARALPSQAITFVLPSCSSPHISVGFRSFGCDLSPGRADVPERGLRHEPAWGESLGMGKEQAVPPRETRFYIPAESWENKKHTINFSVQKTRRRKERPKPTRHHSPSTSLLPRKTGYISAARRQRKR